MTGFGRILEDLNYAGVRYVLIGGIALIRHGVVRRERDLADLADLEAAHGQLPETQVQSRRPDLNRGPHHYE